MVLVRRYLWVGGVGLSFGLIAVGILFIVMAMDAKVQIRAELVSEQVMTSADAAIPGVPVTDAKTAQAQADVIKAHSHERYGLYSEMGRDDPNRQTYLSGMTLRNSLGLAVLAFGLSDLALGSGAVLLILGLAARGFGVPVLYWLRVPESERVSRV